MRPQAGRGSAHLPAAPSDVAHGDGGVGAGGPCDVALADPQSWSLESTPLLHSIFLPLLKKYMLQHLRAQLLDGKKDLFSIPLQPGVLRQLAVVLQPAGVAFVQQDADMDLVATQHEVAKVYEEIKFPMFCPANNNTNATHNNKSRHRGPSSHKRAQRPKGTGRRQPACKRKREHIAHRLVLRARPPPLHKCNKQKST